jgi:hypothetical protein
LLAARAAYQAGLDIRVRLAAADRDLRLLSDSEDSGHVFGTAS